ncbi:MAG: type I-MYXAN CRISPR-associated protein Cas6/Cmx6 [Rhodocyclaceae bacterium]
MIADPCAEVVDLAFGVKGEAIAADCAERLQRSVLGVLSWMEHEPGAGIHPLRGTSGGGDRRLLSQRAQLVLRLPLARVGAARALSGLRFDLDGEIELGASAVRPLAPYHVVYSRFVSTGDEDECAFLAAVEGAATMAGIDCKLIAGKPREGIDGQQRYRGFSLMLHGLSPGHSLMVQSLGIGGRRLLGCGVFVPHKSIAPVGG